MPSDKNTCNLIITGVGGQGNVLTSQLIAKALVKKGYFVTIGETYGASQRGGTVMSHIRINKNRQLSPLVPKNKCEVLLALEPVEAIRVLAEYGNSNVVALVNNRPIYPVDVISGKKHYPEMELIERTLSDLALKVYYIQATIKASEMGSPILSNTIMTGALLTLDLLPLSIEEFIETIANIFDRKRLEMNIRALEVGRNLVKGATSIPESHMSSNRIKPF